MTSDTRILRRRVRVLLGLFLVGLVLSGLTALPIVAEVEFLHAVLGEAEGAWCPRMAGLIATVHRGVTEANECHPFLFYGTDWLAFGHLVIAIAFLGPLRDPVRNIWVIEWGMIACVLVIPTAMVCGPIRGIPFWWRLIDCSFGVVGILPLALAWRCTRRMGAIANK